MRCKTKSAQIFPEKSHAARPAHQPHQKGQYMIVSELLLFGLGILITSYVIVNFNNVQDVIKGVTLADQMESVADVLSTAVVKVANTENSSVRLIVPDKISDTTYKISIKDADGGKLVITSADGLTSIERQLFNINYDNIVGSNNVINNSEVLSTAEFIEVVKNEKITLRRLPADSDLVV